MVYKQVDSMGGNMVLIVEEGAPVSLLPCTSRNASQSGVHEQTYVVASSIITSQQSLKAESGMAHGGTDLPTA